MSRTNISIYLPRDVIERLNDRARRANLPRSRIVEDAIMRSLREPRLIIDFEDEVERDPVVA
jgi:hypothetical protein